MASNAQLRSIKLADWISLLQASGLKRKLLFTLGMISLYRLGILIPLWGVNSIAIRQVTHSQLFGFLDLFSGGALTSVSILALGIGPYITSSILVQLLTAVIPHFEELQKEEGEAGRRKLAQYTRYATVALAVVQSVLILRFIASVPGAIHTPLMWFYPLGSLTLVAGSIFVLWLSELITDRGIGNGGSLLIMTGILSRIPVYATQTSTLIGGDGQKTAALILLLLIYLVIISLIIVLQDANRKIPIIHARRQRGAMLYLRGNSYIPFKINPAGVMPIIFAFAILAFPSMVMGFVQQSHPTGWVLAGMQFYGKYLAPGSYGYIALEFIFIVFFTFFYSSLIPSMQPVEIADNLRKSGSAIPGVKPGRPTAAYLERILGRTTFIGAVALAVVTLVASSATSLTGITTLQGLGSTSLIILVGVALDLVNQVRVHLLVKQYEGFLKPAL